MIGFLVYSIFVIALLVVFWLVAGDVVGRIIGIVAAGFVLFLIWNFLFSVAIKSEAKGPCHKYETKRIYNDAFSCVCVLRGEWVDDEEEP